MRQWTASRTNVKWQRRTEIAVGKANSSWRKTLLATIAGLTLACGLAGPALAQSDGPFRIVKSFPVSEPTWGAKVGDLYLVGAERAVLVYRRTGAGVGDYRLVNQLVPGLDGRIENGIVDGDWLYVAEYNGGGGVYDVTDPLNPTLRFRYTATGRPISGRNNPGAVTKFALHANAGYLIRDGTVESATVTSSNLTPVAVFAPAASLQTGMRQYAGTASSGWKATASSPTRKAWMNCGWWMTCRGSTASRRCQAPWNSRPARCKRAAVTSWNSAPTCTTARLGHTPVRRRQPAMRCCE
jgi:hypothetical protein